ncbi:MAG: DUF3025 domain-containing protein [Myxococcota bacterium]
MSTTRRAHFQPTRWLEVPALEPYSPWLMRFFQEEREGRWPDVGVLAQRLEVPLRFWTPRGRLPVGLDESDVGDSYIGHCVRGTVPTRAENLHDFFNALTWARFPRAKAALCQRHFDLALSRGPHTNRLRTRAQDRLSMVDEGGVLTVADGISVVFGHGLLEDEVRGRGSRGLSLAVPNLDDVTVAEAVRQLPLDTERELLPAALRDR